MRSPGFVVSLMLLLVVLLAQSVETSPFWNSPVGQVLAWMVAIALLLAAIAGGVTASRSLIRSVQDGRRWTGIRWRERQRREKVLDQVLSPAGWPNGSGSIVDSHNALYEKLKAVDKKLDTKLQSVATKDDVAEIRLRVVEIQRTVEEIHG